MTPAKVRFETITLIVVGIALLCIMSVYWVAQGQLTQQYSVKLEPIRVPVGDAAITEGERQARIHGCFWCHGPQLAGQKYFADPARGVIVVAPNLTRKIREYSPAEFARTVRHGVRPDATSLQPAMPSFAFYNMSDADMGNIMAFIGSLPETSGLEGRFRLLPVGWFRWVAGKLPPNAADLIDHDAPRPDPAVGGDPVARGRYLAESICTECHGDAGRLRVPGSPDLIVASAYSRDDFVRLIRTGVPVGERAIDYHMVDVAKYRYTAFTDTEVDALYQYFRSLASIRR